MPNLLMAAVAFAFTFAFATAFGFWRCHGATEPVAQVGSTLAMLCSFHAQVAFGTELL